MRHVGGPGENNGRVRRAAAGARAKNPATDLGRQAMIEAEEEDPSCEGGPAAADGSDKLKVGVLCGSDSLRLIHDDKEEPVVAAGNNDSWRFLSRLQPARFSWSRVHLTPNYFRQARRFDLRQDRVVWNVISDPDQNPRLLPVAERFLAEARVPVVNPPAQVLRTTRDQVAARLQGLPGVVAPKVLLLRHPTLERVRRQVDDAGFRFPAILRRTGTHNGSIVGVFERLEDIGQIFGDRRDEYFLIEFLDLRFPDGSFRKTRFFFIGDAVVPRHHVVSDSWNIHGRDARRFMTDKPELIEESAAVLHGGFAGLPAGFRESLKAIRPRVGLDYFGLDACMTWDGRLVVFEANATMSFHFINHDAVHNTHNRAAFGPATEAVRELLLAKARPAAKPAHLGPGAVRPAKPGRYRSLARSR